MRQEMIAHRLGLDTDQLGSWLASAAVRRVAPAAWQLRRARRRQLTPDPPMWLRPWVGRETRMPS